MRTIPGLKADVTAAEACRLVAQMFRAGGLETPELDARVLVAHALKIDRNRLAASGDRLLDAREADAVAARAARRLSREPVARIVGRKEFWSLDLRVEPAVLVPRPETETVVEAVLASLDAAARNRPLRLLDIGTGSGALLLSLLHELPNAFGLGVDLSAAAVEVARVNAVRLGLARRCAFVVGDGGRALSGPFDVIVSNPPYIRTDEIASLAPDVRDHDPALALDGGPDGLDGYRMIARDAFRLLAPGGRLVVELGPGQDVDTTTLLMETGLTFAALRNDLNGVHRALTMLRVSAPREPPGKFAGQQ
ncbi:MAG TPA: peptide chain release factor N(5)-glutamine methyltransferase [Pseudolabrys sp.]|nr:peptide chain release factor N(5)-glutamine methyltransferase [Pseudolabrys sp.]